MLFVNNVEYVFNQKIDIRWRKSSKGYRQKKAKRQASEIETLKQSFLVFVVERNWMKTETGMIEQRMTTKLNQSLDNNE